MTIFEQLQAFTPFNEQEASDRRLLPLLMHVLFG